MVSSRIDFHDRTQAARAGPAVDRLLGDDVQRLVLEGQLGVLHLEQTLILLDERILRLDQDPLQRFLVEILERRQNRQTADELRNEAELQQILRLDPAQDVAGAALVRRYNRGAEADRRLRAARGDDLFETGEGAAADEQDVGRIDLQEFLLRMLAAALRRHGRNRAFHDLQQAPAARPRPKRRG